MNHTFPKNGSKNFAAMGPTDPNKFNALTKIDFARK